MAFTTRRLNDVSGGNEEPRATIAPVPSGTARPLWSVMIPTFHCADYLAETLKGVLAQDPGPEQMQIEVVDDHSTADDPERVVHAVGAGRVAFFRQQQNVGHTTNFDTCVQRSRGRLVHILHGDDGVRPRFYTTMARAFEGNQGVGAAFCRHITMREDSHWSSIAPVEQRERGVLRDALEHIASRQPIHTPAMVVRRDVYERLGGFDHRMRSCGEDWEMWVRIAAHYPIWYEPEPLALYRKHDHSLTGRSLRTGDNIRDLRRAIDIYAGSLPSTSANRVVAEARRRAAAWAVMLARREAWSGNLLIAGTQLREAFTTSMSAATLLGALRVVMTASGRALRAARDRVMSDGTPA